MLALARLPRCVELLILTALAANAQQVTTSPAQQAIAEAEAAIAQAPGDHEGYNALAQANARRARETADPLYYGKAEAALKKSLELQPANFQALKLQAWLLLGKHEFGAALNLARELNKKNADDWQVYGLITDACVELGKYKEAEEAAQWMLDLGRSNVPGLTRAAYLRELFGDIEGALELLMQAYGRIHPSQTEDRAWVLVHIGHLQAMTGDHDHAEATLTEALRLFPGYHYALANLAKVRSAQGRYGEAASLFEQRYRAAPHPENLYDVAFAQWRANMRAEAKASFALFEELARKESASEDNANRELIFYYADFQGNAQQALTLARKEIAKRRDVHTLDASAWALYRAGDASGARRQMEEALAVGIRDARIFYHAGAIAAKQKDYEASRRFLNKSLELNPRSEVQADVRSVLKKLPSQVAAGR